MTRNEVARIEGVETYLLRVGPRTLPQIRNYFRLQRNSSEFLKTSDKLRYGADVTSRGNKQTYLWWHKDGPSPSWVS